MTNENDRRRNKPERRKDAPSGRQAATHPEHDTGKIDQAPSSLHQGQGPDFLTQDSHIQQRNPAVQNLKKGATHPAKEPEHINRPQNRHTPNPNDPQKTNREDNTKERKG